VQSNKKCGRFKPMNPYQKTRVFCDFRNFTEFVSIVLKKQKNLYCSMGCFLLFVRTTVDFLAIWRYYIRGQSEHDRTKMEKMRKR